MQNLMNCRYFHKLQLQLEKKKKTEEKTGKITIIMFPHQ